VKHWEGVGIWIEGGSGERRGRGGRGSRGEWERRRGGEEREVVGGGGR